MVLGMLFSSSGLQQSSRSAVVGSESPMLSMWLMICSVRCAQYSALKGEACVEGDGSEARRPANQVSNASDQVVQPTELGSNWWR